MKQTSKTRQEMQILQAEQRTEAPRPEEPPEEEGPLFLPDEEPRPETRPTKEQKTKNFQAEKDQPEKGQPVVQNERHQGALQRSIPLSSAPAGCRSIPLASAPPPPPSAPPPRARELYGTTSHPLERSRGLTVSTTDSDTRSSVHGQCPGGSVGLVFATTSMDIAPPEVSAASYLAGKKNEDGPDEKHQDEPEKQHSVFEVVERRSIPLSSTPALERSALERSAPACCAPPPADGKLNGTTSQPLEVARSRGRTSPSVCSVMASVAAEDDRVVPPEEVSDSEDDCVDAFATRTSVDIAPASEVCGRFAEKKEFEVVERRSMPRSRRVTSAITSNPLERSRGLTLFATTSVDIAPEEVSEEESLSSEDENGEDHSNSLLGRELWLIGNGDRFVRRFQTSVISAPQSMM